MVCQSYEAYQNALLKESVEKYVSYGDSILELCYV